MWWTLTGALIAFLGVVAAGRGFWLQYSEIGSLKLLFTTKTPTVVHLSPAFARGRAGTFGWHQEPPSNPTTEQRIALLEQRVETLGEGLRKVRSDLTDQVGDLRMHVDSSLANLDATRLNEQEAAKRLALRAARWEFWGLMAAGGGTILGLGSLLGQ